MELHSLYSVWDFSSVYHYKMNFLEWVLTYTSLKPWNESMLFLWHYVPPGPSCSLFRFPAQGPSLNYSNTHLLPSAIEVGLLCTFSLRLPFLPPSPRLHHITRLTSADAYQIWMWKATWGGKAQKISNIFFFQFKIVYCYYMGIQCVTLHSHTAVKGQLPRVGLLLPQ